MDKDINRNTLKSNSALKRHETATIFSSDKRASLTAVGSSRPLLPLLSARQSRVIRGAIETSMASHSWLAVLAAAAWLFGVAVASSPDASIDVEEPIRILVCATNVENANGRLQDLARMFDSVLRRAQHRPLHWILLVKPDDVAVVDPLLRHITAAQAKVESRIEYVDMNAIINHFSARINLTRTHLLCADPLHTSRYWNEVG